MALFLPPLRTGQCGARRSTARDKATAARRTCRERPARFDPHINVHAARAAGFRPAAKADLIEEALDFKRDTAHIGPAHAGNRIQIDA